jgi:hypothetical protein
MVPIPIFNFILFGLPRDLKIKIHTDKIGTGAHLMICPAQKWITI